MIKISGVNKAFGKKIVFSDFNLKIPDGSFVIISGNSGSGKTTLLNMIGGIEKPDSGSIEVDGTLVTNTKKRTNILLILLDFFFKISPCLKTKQLCKI